jgi:hypothetical protein
VGQLVTLEVETATATATTAAWINIDDPSGYLPANLRAPTQLDFLIQGQDAGSLVVAGLRTGTSGNLQINVFPVTNFTASGLGGFLGFSISYIVV